MDEIILKATDIANKCAEKIGLKILEVEYVHEHGIKILRIIADSNQGLTIDESTELNQLISEELDKDDFIHDEYYLEVSSPGLERPLKNTEDIKAAIGEYINIRTYEKIDGQKEFNGTLLSYDDIVKLEVNVKGRIKTLAIEKQKISKIRLAVKF